jgi:hypothetical protein
VTSSFGKPLSVTSSFGRPLSVTSSFGKPLSRLTEQQARDAFTSRVLLGRMLEEDEVGQAVVAILRVPGLHAADIDLSAGMVAW